nr:MAG TPA: YopX protein [Caudoviricetes sp.]
MERTMIPRFRAWDKEYKEMVQVDALVFDEQIIKATYKNGNVVKEDLKNYVLMQSTGLRDKDGKEIFEGDIVKMAKNVYSELTYYEVVRHRGGAYRLESKRYGCELWLRHTDCEIAGNIWENPELLEVKQ